MLSSRNPIQIDIYRSSFPDAQLGFGSGFPFEQPAVRNDTANHRANHGVDRDQRLMSQERNIQWQC